MEHGAVANERKGWVFITSKPTMRERMRPLVSLWLDLLVLRMMNDDTVRRKTWDGQRTSAIQSSLWPSGEIGSHSRLKICRGQPHVGSTPTSATISASPPRSMQRFAKMD
jgi:type IV secretion system coupling TraD/TrwB family protein